MTNQQKNKKVLRRGSTLPNLILRHLSKDGLKDVMTEDLFKNKKVVLFGLPGAFTPVCSARHLPGYVRLLSLFKEKGYEVICLSVNDPFVMDAWMRVHSAEGITAMADGNADFTNAIGMIWDYTAYGFGLRSKRFALVAHNGIVEEIFTEKAGEFEASSAEAMLAFLGVTIPADLAEDNNPCKNK